MILCMVREWFVVLLCYLRTLITLSSSSASVKTASGALERSAVTSLCDHDVKSYHAKVYPLAHSTWDFVSIFYRSL